MTTAMHTIGKLTLVVAIATLLLSGVVSGAAAAPRSEGISQANDYIYQCTLMGGDPVVIMDTTGENLTVLCRYSDGRVAVCPFLPVKKDCQWVTPIKAGTPTPGIRSR